ncbi:CapA family protein [Pseudalkalibacillus sp. A8]|uniref:CapA family protein n=1 Tax=Pseudalkalibacillus sp. A8 TaxID=3382641 RepID=UPI0038B6855B
MNELTLTATGDTFLTRRHPSTDLLSFQNVKNIISQGDVRFTNLEVTLHNQEGFPSAFSGGTWAMASPSVLEDLKAYGFNILAWANNHTMDYSYGGLFATKRYIEEYGFLHAGVGKNLHEASRPVYLETPNGRVALISATSTFHESWRAGESRPDTIGRPGINPLRFESLHYVKESDIEVLKNIALRTDVNAKRNLDIQEGFEVEENDFFFGSLRFAKAQSYAQETNPYKKDLYRIIKRIKEARRQADYVLVSIHSHEMKGANKELSADFFEKAARKFIDEGADVILGHGPHILRGIEIYKNRPIFYSLGNFIFQNDSIETLPSDFYEKYQLTSDANVADAIDKRSENNTIGLGTNPKVWKSIIPVLKMDGKGLVEFNIYPIELGYGQKRYNRGWPSLSTDTTIIEELQLLSLPYGTKINIEDGKGKFVLES